MRITPEFAAVFLGFGYWERMETHPWNFPKGSYKSNKKNCKMPARSDHVSFLKRVAKRRKKKGYA